MKYGAWKLDHGRPGMAPCMKPKGHEGEHDPDYDPQVEQRIRRIGSTEDRKDFSTYYYKTKGNQPPDVDVFTVDNSEEEYEFVNPERMYINKDESTVVDFIKSHVNAMKFEYDRTSEPGIEFYRHVPEGCKHCEALAAFDRILDQRDELAKRPPWDWTDNEITALQEQLRLREHDIDLKQGVIDHLLEDQARMEGVMLNQMSQILGLEDEVELEKEKKLEAYADIFDLKGQLDEMTNRKDEYVDELQACNAQLHDQDKHELGQQCADLQDQFDTLLALVEGSGEISPAFKDKMRKILGLGGE